MGADFFVHNVMLAVARVHAFNCLISVHAGITAFLCCRAVANLVHCGDGIERKLLFRDGAPHLGVVMRLVLSAGVLLLLECYDSSFAIELSQMALWCVVAFPEGLLPHELPKSVAVVVLARAARALLLGCQDHGAQTWVSYLRAARQSRAAGIAKRVDA